MDFGVWVKGEVFGGRDEGRRYSVDGQIPRLYLISNQQNKPIQQMGTLSDTAWEWNLQWRRFLLESETIMGANFLEDLQDLSNDPNHQDQWIWKGDASGRYIVGSAYKLLDSDARDKNQDGAFRELWKLKIPAKAAFFAWRLLRDRLPTKNNL